MLMVAADAHILLIQQLQASWIESIVSASGASSAPSPEYGLVGEHLGGIQDAGQLPRGPGAWRSRGGLGEVDDRVAVAEVDGHHRLVGQRVADELDVAEGLRLRI